MSNAEAAPERLHALARRTAELPTDEPDGHRLAAFRAAMDDDLDPFSADLGLELVGGAGGDDLSVVDDRDRVGQLVDQPPFQRRARIDPSAAEDHPRGTLAPDSPRDADGAVAAGARGHRLRL